MAKASDSSSDKDLTPELALYRCPHCGEMRIEVGELGFELSRDDFFRFRDLVNEAAMDLPDRCSIHNPNRYEHVLN